MLKDITAYSFRPSPIPLPPGERVTIKTLLLGFLPRPRGERAGVRVIIANTKEWHA